MRPLDLDTTRQQARDFSAQLGQLSAGLPTGRQEPPHLPGTPASSRLRAVLAGLLPRTQAHEHAEHKLKAEEFAAGT